MSQQGPPTTFRVSNPQTNSKYASDQSIGVYSWLIWLDFELDLCELFPALNGTDFEPSTIVRGSSLTVGLASKQPSPNMKSVILSLSRSALQGLRVS